MFAPNFQLTTGIASALMRMESRHLRETAALNATHYSTQIEANRLTLPQVREAIRGGADAGPRARRARASQSLSGSCRDGSLDGAICVDNCLYKV